jgi:flavin-dependent dehydrogenase
MHTAIIGGGPAGAMTGLLLSREGIKVSIFEPRPKKTPELGEKIEPCVGCAGLVQENALALLESSGLSLPAEIVQTKIKNNIIHFPGGESLVIPCQALTVYRGFGPAGRKGIHQKVYGFDAWLLKEAEKAGATIIEAAVRKISSNGDGVELSFNGDTLKADMAVGAYGHNKLEIEFPRADEALEEPVIQPACVREYYLGERFVKENLADSQHIFGNPTKNIWYASIFPKGGFISIALMGKKGAMQGDFKQFLSLENVQELIGKLINQKLSCGCTSSITVRSPRTCVYKDKNGGFLMVKIGDAGASRPRKNGIFAALDSAVRFSESIARYGNTAKAVGVFKRYTTVNYVWDNVPAEIVLRSTDLFLNYRLPRRLIVYLGSRNVPVVSKAVNGIFELVSTGRAPYWQIPWRMMFD